LSSVVVVVGGVVVDLAPRSGAISGRVVAVDVGVVTAPIGSQETVQDAEQPAVGFGPDDHPIVQALFIRRALFDDPLRAL